jgi:hypothetical protein
LRRAGAAGTGGPAAGGRSPRRVGRARCADCRESSGIGCGVDDRDLGGNLPAAVAIALPLCLELAAPAVLAYGFAPMPRKEAPPRKKAKRRKMRAAPRKPAPRKANATILAFAAKKA